VVWKKSLGAFDDLFVGIDLALQLGVCGLALCLLLGVGGAKQPRSRLSGRFLN
jgi:hypothetical protein